MRKTLFSATIPATVANTMFAQLPTSAAWTPHNKGQQSNGYGKKTITSDYGECEISVPRDHNGEFEPKVIEKRQTHTDEIEQKIMTMYAKGMSQRDIEDTLKEIYGAEISQGLVSRITDKIASGLERDGILTGAGNPRWHTSTIAKILRNEKYMGDALLQKTYTVDYLSKKRIKNNGIMPQYYVENDHEAIIPKDIFMRVQDELVRRRLVKVSPNGRKHGFSSNHVFSQMIVCGECGELFCRVHWNNHGCRSIVWRCISRLESTGIECHARTINELVLQDAIVKAINQMLGDKSNYQAQLQLNIVAVIRASQATAIDSIDEKLMTLQQDLIQKANSKEDYDEIADEIFRLRELRQKTTVDTAARDEQIKRINDLQDYIAQQTTYLTEFDEALVRRWIKQITIWDDRITVELKSGVSIDVDA